MSVKGEKYASKKAMMKHETSESPAMRKKEYGSVKGGMFAKKAVAKKAAVKKMGKKK
jgi:hypothetical protein